jgi:hypothetical protein
MIAMEVAVKLWVNALPILSALCHDVALICFKMRRLETFARVLKLAFARFLKRLVTVSVFYPVKVILPVQMKKINAVLAQHLIVPAQV